MVQVSLPNPKKTSSECPLRGDQEVGPTECVWRQVLNGEEMQKKGQEEGKEMRWKMED